MLKLEIIGNIGADAKVQNHNGNEFVAFNVAHSEKVGDKEVTTWVSCTTRNTKIAQYLTKGTKVYIRGNMSVRTYQTDQHVTMAAINLYANEIEFCGGSRNANNNAPVTPAPTENMPLPNINPDDDAPF